MKCLYCNNICQPPEFNTTWGAFCDLCDIYYSLTVQLGVCIAFTRKIRDNIYYLHLYPEKSLTSLYGYMPHKRCSAGHLCIRLESCIQNVTPSNCLDKIKTLLVFS